MSGYHFGWIHLCNQKLMSQPGFSELQMIVSFNDKDWVEFQLSKQVIIIDPFGITAV